MGADLCGYLVKGPKSIGHKREEAIAAVTRINEIFKKMEGDPDDDEDELTWDDLSDDEKQITEHFDEEILFCPWEYAIEDVAEFVDEFIKFWDWSGARDTAFREDPDDNNQKIVFAGDMSWGDEPQGLGYGLLRDANLWGMFPVFGIR